VFITCLNENVILNRIIPNHKNVYHCTFEFFYRRPKLQPSIDLILFQTTHQALLKHNKIMQPMKESMPISRKEIKAEVRDRG
jgi:hypothetical protein